MKTQRPKSQLVFVVKFYDKEGIYEDDIVEVTSGRYRSIKFRHTYYRTDDFFYTYKEAQAYVRMQQLNGLEPANEA